VSLASTLLLFAAEKAVENALASGEGLEPPGDCTKLRHAELHRDQGLKCKGPARSCAEDQVKAGDCVQLRIRSDRNRLCAEAMRRIMDECFRGGDERHKRVLRQELGVLSICEERARKECP
jgi:hypothetical protein